MATTTLNANRSVHIDSSSPTTNQDGSPQLDVGESALSSELRRGLVGFDLSSLANSTINSVTLKIYDTGASTLTSNTRTLSVYRLKRAWVENQATWNVYSTGNSWSTARASHANDRDSSDSGTYSAASPPPTGYQSITINTANFQEMVDGTFTNNGFILVMGTETNDMHRYNGSGEANPPQLVVDYTPKGKALFFSQL